jgi:hypothetical protein
VSEEKKAAIFFDWLGSYSTTVPVVWRVNLKGPILSRKCTVPYRFMSHFHERTHVLYIPDTSLYKRGWTAGPYIEAPHNELYSTSRILLAF